MNDIEKMTRQVEALLRNERIIEDGVEAAALRPLHEAINELVKRIDECERFVEALVDGQLDSEVPGRENALAGGIKALHAHFKHLTWQANQVAKGDYKQRVDFLGDFSDAFNQMIRQLKEREEALQEKNKNLQETTQLLYAVMDSLKEGLVIRDLATNKILYTNDAADALFGDTSLYLPCGQGGCAVMHYLANYAHNEKQGRKEITCCSKNRILQIESYHVVFEEYSTCVHLIADITEEKAQEQQLESFAFEDALTGTYNRRYCMQFLETLIHRESSFALCFIDLDKLKDVNDNFGHLVGDNYIKDVATYLKCIKRSSDVLARIGGDEFILLLYGCSESDAACKLDRVNEELARATRNYKMSISFGIHYVAESREMATKEVLEAADAAMYEAKRKKNEHL